MATFSPFTVFYDGACPLCAREIAYYQRLDRAGRVRFVDVAAPDAVCPIDREALLARFHIRDEAGRLDSGAAAFVALWARLPAPWPAFAALARLPGALMLGEGLYRLFLRVRPALQRRLRTALSRP